VIQINDDSNDRDLPLDANIVIKQKTAMVETCSTIQAGSIDLTIDVDEDEDSFLPNLDYLSMVFHTIKPSIIESRTEANTIDYITISDDEDEMKIMSSNGEDKEKNPVIEIPETPKAVNETPKSVTEPPKAAVTEPLKAVNETNIDEEETELVSSKEVGNEEKEMENSVESEKPPAITPKITESPVIDDPEPEVLIQETAETRPIESTSLFIDSDARSGYNESPRQENDIRNTEAETEKEKNELLHDINSEEAVSILEQLSGGGKCIFETV